MQLRENEHYYFESGLMVLTVKYLLERGYCCQNGCRHCPYGFRKEDRDAVKNQKESSNSNSEK